MCSEGYGSRHVHVRVSITYDIHNYSDFLGFYLVDVRKLGCEKPNMVMSTHLPRETLSFMLHNT